MTEAVWRPLPPVRGQAVQSIIRAMTGAASEPSDEALMQAFAGGDALAFETLYDRHALPVWRFVQRSVRNAALADDLVQDVWFRLLRHAPQYEVRAKFRTWLYTLAHHRVVDHWRSHRPHESLDADTDDDMARLEVLSAGTDDGPEHRLDSREQAQALLDALAALPAAQREAFLLQAEAGMTVAEIAQATGVSPETAKSRLRYARARLRETLEAHA